MDSLKSKHLLPYVGTVVQAYGASDFWKIEGCTTKKVIIKNGKSTQALSFEDFHADYSLLLRPFSDLINEVEINGEKIIPLRELLHIHEDEELEQFAPYEYASDDGCYGIKFTDCEGISCSFAYHEKIKMFGVMVIPERRPAWTYRQCELFEQLYDWGFDVSGLIDYGLAEDINNY